MNHETGLTVLQSIVTQFELMFYLESGHWRPVHVYFLLMQPMTVHKNCKIVEVTEMSFHNADNTSFQSQKSQWAKTRRVKPAPSNILDFR